MPAKKDSYEKDLDHNREQKGAQHPASSVGSEIPDTKEDSADHLSHNGEKDDERRGVER